MGVACRLGFDWKCTFMILLLTSSLTVPALAVLIKCADTRQSYFIGTCFANCSTLMLSFWQMFLRVGGPSCTGSAADESSDIGAIRYCFRFLIFCYVFKSQRSKCECCRKTWQIFALIDPLWKIGEGWWRYLYELFVPHIGSKHRYTFTRRRLASGYTLGGWLKKKNRR